VWAGFALVWLVGMRLLLWRRGLDLVHSLLPTHSLVERFGLFTIIVLGELVFDVVNGLSAVERDSLTIATGMLGLAVGFGYWWVYFDFVAGRLPRVEGRAVSDWLLSHLPVTLAIAASGAAIVNLVGHAHDPRTPPGAAWPLAGAVALSLLALIPIEQALVDAERLGSVYRPLGLALVGGAAAALGAGWSRPTPWLLALLLVAILSALWFFAVSRFLRADAWGDTRTTAGAEP
jgi:low temperature requirement protein LtrA